MRVVCSFIHYPVAIGRYYQFALQRLAATGAIELKTAGPYTGAWIPWAGGINLPVTYAKPPDIVIPATAVNQPVPIEFIERQLGEWQPDLWLQVDAGFHLIGKPKHGKNFIVATDPHVLNYDRQRGYADKFFCMQTPYAKPGDEYLPYAYDPEWHSPEEQLRNYDVCLIGLNYPQRTNLVNRLRERGLKVYYDLGPSYAEARALYNQAPIGLNWSSLLDLTARVFELLGMGRLAVVNRVPDLERFFVPGRDLVGFSSLEEAVEAVTYYHENTEEAIKIAIQGYKTVQPHTWDARIERVLSYV